jgi:multiple sugar transport system permease protein
MTRREWRDLGKGLAFLSPWLIGFLGLTLLPAILSFYYSFCDYSLLQKPAWMGLENYKNLLWSFQGGDLFSWVAAKGHLPEEAFHDSLGYAAAALIFCVLFAIALVSWIDKKLVSPTVTVIIALFPAWAVLGALKAWQGIATGFELDAHLRWAAQNFALWRFGAALVFAALWIIWMERKIDKEDSRRVGLLWLGLLPLLSVSVVWFTSFYIQMGHWEPNFGDKTFWQAAKNTLYYAAITLPAGALVSLGLALLLNIKLKAQPYYRTIIYLPTLVPTIAGAMVWMWIYNDKLGLFNTILTSDLVNMKAIGWLSHEEWALPSIALMSLWGVGNAVVIYLAGLQDVPVELHEAAEIDGASPLQRMLNVTLPMLSPVIFFNMVMAIIGTLQVFNEPFIMTSGGPVHATYMLTQYLYESAFQNLRMGYASSMAWLQLLIILALTGLAFGLSKRWVHYHGE